MILRSHHRSVRPCRFRTADLAWARGYGGAPPHVLAGRPPAGYRGCPAAPRSAWPSTLSTAALAR